MSDKASKDEVRLLKAQIGNLEVQNSEYQQIVKELSEKLQKYEALTQEQRIFEQLVVKQKCVW